MGLKFVNIILVNGTDLILAKKQMIREDEIRKINVKILVEPGAYKMKINETIQEQLQLPFIEKKGI